MWDLLVVVHGHRVTTWWGHLLAQVALFPLAPTQIFAEWKVECKSFVIIYIRLFWFDFNRKSFPNKFPQLLLIN